jgi:hypothetical protein
VSEHRPESTTPEAGWYADPDGAGQLRWWSGTEWTDQYAPMADAAGSAYGPAAAAQPTAVGTLEHPRPADLAPTQYGYAPYPPATVNPRLRWGTVSVWFLAFSPWLTMASGIAAFYVYVSTLDATPYWILVLLGAHALTTGLAVLDGRRLRQWQHPQVPHWAWSLPGVPVYLIARAVVLRGSTVRGTAPLWVALANIVLTWVLFFVVFFLVGALTLYIIQALSDSMNGIN